MKWPEDVLYGDGGDRGTGAARFLPPIYVRSGRAKWGDSGDTNRTVGSPSSPVILDDVQREAINHSGGTDIMH